MYKRYVELRDKKGVTDYKVSLETGIPKSTFSEWKSGRSNPKIEKLKKIADYFGVTQVHENNGISQRMRIQAIIPYPSCTR